MSRIDRRAPLPVIASTVPWKRADGTSIPAVRITGHRSTILVGPDNLEELAHAVVTALQTLEQQRGGEAA